MCVLFFFCYLVLHLFVYLAIYFFALFIYFFLGVWLIHRFESTDPIWDAHPSQRRGVHRSSVPSTVSFARTDPVSTLDGYFNNMFYIICLLLCIYIYVYRYVCIHIHIYIYIHFVQNISSYTHIYIYIHICTVLSI